ncbi:POU domain, class 5, transcription factor 1.1-like [Aquarana catesbeiana]|uniref:POU domain, class 5, transcription factor 1.1-like n=1 Tax=Aquarana catesbeiana TaxID=8400 RepID=UPI003CCA6985
MCSQQAYPSFTLNHGIIQEGSGGYYHPFQAFFSPVVRTDGGDLGEHQAQVMAWNHAPQLEPPGHLNLCAPPSHPLNMETSCMAESRKIGKSEDCDGSVSHPVLQYYPHDWNPAFWPGSPNFSSQTQKNANIPGSKVYLTPTNQSPNMPVETMAANMERSRCSSAPTQEVVKESDSLASQTVTSVGTQEKTLFKDLEDTLEMLSEMELEQFARDMKQKRFDMGFSQADVCYVLKAWYGKTFSPTTIAKFESVKLSYRYMCRIKLFLQRWLKDIEKNEHLQEMIHHEQALALSRKRKRRTDLNKIAEDCLEIFFMKKPKPDPQQLEQIADFLQIETDVVYVWFCNRLQSLVVKEPSNKNYEPQPIVPHVGVFSHQEMPFLGYRSGSPPMYNPAFHHKNMFQQHVPHGLQHGNQIC